MWCRKNDSPKKLTGAGGLVEIRSGGWMAKRPATHTQSGVTNIDNQCDGSLSVTLPMLPIWTFWLNNFHLSSWHNYTSWRHEPNNGEYVDILSISHHPLHWNLHVHCCQLVYIYVKARLGDKLPDHFCYWRATSGGRWKRWAKLVISVGWRRVQSSNQAGISAHSPIHPWLTPLHRYKLTFLLQPGFHLYLIWPWCMKWR